MDQYIKINNLETFYQILQPKLKTGADRISKKKYWNYSYRQTLFSDIENDVNNFKYKVHKYKKIKINKNRTIFIPTIRDQIVCEVLKKSLDKKIKIKYPNRDFFIKDLILNLNEISNLDKNSLNFIKIDIKKCFDNISKPLLFQKLKNSKYISENQFFLIKQFLKYSDKGIPPGISLSNFLVEYFLENLDSDLKKISPKLCFYRRYVDDIIILFNGSFSYHEEKEIKKSIFDLFKKYHLKFNKNKCVNLFTINNSNSFSYLGYNFKKNNNKIIVEINHNKILLLKQKLKFCFDSYSKNKNKILLKNRLKFIFFNSSFNKRKVTLSKSLYPYSTKIKVNIGFFSTYKFSSHDYLKNTIKNCLLQYLYKHHELLDEFKPFFISYDGQRFFKHPTTKEKCIDSLIKLNLCKPEVYAIKNLNLLKKEYLKKVIVKMRMTKK